jgi:hypothetical protein
MQREEFATEGRATGTRATLKNFMARIGKKPPMPEYALHYYDSLRAKFEMLPQPPASDPVAKKAYLDAGRVANAEREALSWADLMLLDLSIMRSVGFDALRLKIVDMRAKLDGAAPALPEGLIPKLDAAKPEDIEALRAEAEVLVTRIWHLRMARNARDRYVGELRGTLFTSLLWIITLFFIVSIVIADVPLYFVIITAGMLGAVTSFLRRLQAVLTAAPGSDQSSDLSALAYEKRAALMSLMVGGVFAMVLYLLFAAGLSELSGELGPKFAFPAEYDAGGVDFLQFVLSVGPKEGADYAKVVVWAFIAGFFESLVPDVLDRVANKK